MITLYHFPSLSVAFYLSESNTVELVTTDDHGNPLYFIATISPNLTITFHPEHPHPPTAIRIPDPLS